MYHYCITMKTTMKTIVKKKLSSTELQMKAAGYMLASANANKREVEKVENIGKTGKAGKTVASAKKRT